MDNTTKTAPAAEATYAATRQPSPATPKGACLIFTDRGKDLGLLILRIFFGLMILSHGIAKIENFSTLSASFPNPLGLGSWLSLLLITTTEVGCGVLIILGLLTRVAALFLSFGMCVAAFLTFPTFSMATSELPLTYLAVFVTLLIAGAGFFSVDAVLRRIYCRAPRNK